jgi:shikimate kinase
MNNIVLIGMPGAGKSTIGVLAAKTLGLDFIDTDILIQQKEGRLLQDIIEQAGIQRFLEIEEACICEACFKNAVIATGGSVVYSNKAMRALKQEGIIIYLKISYEEMIRRIRNITTRGIVLKKRQSLKDLYSERIPLYEQYADITVNSDGKNVEQILDIIIKTLKSKELF